MIKKTVLATSVLLATHRKELMAQAAGEAGIVVVDTSEMKPIIAPDAFKPEPLSSHKYVFREGIYECPVTAATPVRKTHKPNTGFSIGSDKSKKK